MTRILYRGGSVFDAESGTFHPGEVSIEGDRIVDVGIGLDGDREVDAAGWNLLPGLHDVHLHINVSTPILMKRITTPFSMQFFNSVRNLALTLRSGVTSIRDAGGADLGVKRALADGLILGPNLVLSVSNIGTTGGHTDPWLVSGFPAYNWLPHPGRPNTLCDGPDQMRTVARSLFRAGADWLKVCTSGGVMSMQDSPHVPYITAAELEVLVAEAKMRGTWVMAHAQGVAGIELALRCGVRSIEHGTFLDARLCELMIDKGAWFVPTLSANKALLDAVEAGMAVTPETAEKAVEGHEAANNAVRTAHAAGVNIATGTDAGVGPHGRFLDELTLLSKAGMPSGAIWQAATLSSSRLLQTQQDRGRLAPGMRADMVAFSGDPDDMTNLQQRLTTVVRNGVDIADRLAVILDPAA